ncbi:uncharacterized protein [Elaeis guineensis]|uniref:Uncharacterized protein LOC105035303 n=1 Tax=Elaeis guineensis var. tenera TaxID=51953 RepID=A0A6I9QIG4_ELAGV|nr:uncharacterized protein LOC105035303 [Elaeis guineensis]
MKNLYPKGKGKIHPSPASPSASAGGGANDDALAVLKILPAAILALTAALGNEDKEVLTYLITRSLNGAGMVTATGIGGGAGGCGEERRRCRRVGGVHRPLFDCGCFDCYSSFWSRWDCSPDRELIHQAIEAFEEHLANSESKGGGGGGGGRGRRRERRASDLSEKGKKSKEKETRKVEQIIDEKLLEAPAVRFSGEDNAVEVEATAGGGGNERTEVEEEAVEDVNEEAAAAGAERRRGWPDMMGLLNSRLWNLWSPGV